MMTFSRESQKLIAAVLLSPLAIIPAMAAIQTAWFLAAPANPPDLQEQYVGGFMIAVLGLVYGYGFTVLFGLPAFLVSKRFKQASLAAVAAASVIPSVIFGIVLEDVAAFGIMAYFSVAVAILAWWLASEKEKQWL